ncbi:MAG: TonB-dependent receptor [Nannocystaceae bacterium]|nr:TonB-dependent receptor [Nannocystaceae bacterium]
MSLLLALVWLSVAPPSSAHSDEAASAPVPAATPPPAVVSERPTPPPPAAKPAAAPAPARSEPSAAGRRRVLVPRRRPTRTQPERAGSVVTRGDLEERLPRSAPDALNFEPGVYVQQTAHGQQSAYLRGLTGQQTALFFDGVRLNNSTFRQGPNQYFFSVDSRTIESIEVVRGSASTRYGADAMGGAILTRPTEPTLREGGKRWIVHPRGIFTTRTADAALGGRAQLDASWAGRIGVFGGFGYRDVNQLRAGGRVIAPLDGKPQAVPPVFAPDDKTQLGTGFHELTGDVRVVAQINPRHRITLGYYDYRQLDAPRTDKCPPPTAPQDECLRYLQQLRLLSYAKYSVRNGPAIAESVDLTLSYQRQHEDRVNFRGSPSSTRLHGVDTVHTVGTGLSIRSKRFEPARAAHFTLNYGADAYTDYVQSRATQTFIDVDVTAGVPSTQYTPAARYLTSGIWAVVESRFTRFLRVRTGGRLAEVAAYAPAVPERSSLRVDRNWLAAVAHGGVAVLPTRWLTFAFNVDQGFRAPNIDDLTSRQQIGSGFQWENPRLRHEQSTMLEGGILIEHPWIELQAFVFQTWIDRMIQRASREIETCPPNDSGCRESKARFQLVNLDGYAKILGADGSLRLYLPADLFLTATVSYARGRGPNPDATVPDQPAVAPLSRIPPLHGTGEFGWRSRPWGVYLAFATRWAREQTALANQDRKDLRIPRGGTPGYVVFDLRAGWRLDPKVLLTLVFENVADTAYRVHGSSVNGPGRGLLFEAQFGF